MKVQDGSAGENKYIWLTDNWQEHITQIGQSHMIKKLTAWLVIFSGILASLRAQTPPVQHYLSPLRIIWQTPAASGHIQNAQRLLLPGNGQADLTNRNMCILRSDAAGKPALLLDFGKELQGGLQLVTGMSPKGKPIKVRVRLGESASEAMSDVGGPGGATNDHAMRDMILQLPWLGKLEAGNSGFRFVRIDLVDDSTELQLKEIRAISIYRELPYLGSFHCSDSLLNKIWLTGAYTVQLNMQDYLWDGIKRDRLVWIGDMHPETSTIASVFGYNEVVPKSLDLSRDNTPLPEWMNGISTYSMWWIIIQRDWYMHQGNLSYLRQQQEYLIKLIDLLVSKIDSSNSESLDGRFLDWPSSENPQGIHAGLQAMMVLSLSAAAQLCKVLQLPVPAGKCATAIQRLRANVPDVHGSKQAAALLALAGMLPADKANKEVLSVNGAHDFSTFYGYYMLRAKAMAGDYQGALENIRTYWGAMLNLGATTFWEDFNLDWLPGAGRIDELPRSGEKDIHGDYGAYCYKGFRHSLCHGWASGPTPWLTENVLGVSILEPGCRIVKIVPHLGDLQFAEGTFPTPYGLVKIKHVRQADGRISTTVTGPKEVKIIR